MSKSVCTCWASEMKELQKRDGGGGGDGVQSHLKKRAYEGCNFGLPLYPTWIWHTAVCRVNK